MIAATQFSTTRKARLVSMLNFTRQRLSLGGPHSATALGAFVLLLALVGSGSQAEAAQFYGLGVFADAPIHESYARATTPNGSIVVGHSRAPGYLGTQAFYWTPATGLVGLGDFSDGDSWSTAQGISADGATIVGQGSSAAGQEAYRWTEAEGMVGLGDLPGGLFESGSTAISADGNSIVGFANSTAGRQGFRWTAGGGMVGLGDFAGGTFFSSATDVSSDGSVIVGMGSTADGGEAFRWTIGTGLVGLGHLPGGAARSIAHAVSSNGATVVGSSSSAVSAASAGNNNVEAFRWTAAGGMVGLGDLPGGAFNSLAFDTSGDGSIVVGQSDVGGDGFARDFEAFLWDELNGMRNLRDVLINEYGLGDSLNGWTLRSARGISEDGLTIVGYGIGPDGHSAWVVDLHPVPEPSSLLLAALGILGLAIYRRRFRRT